MNNRSYSPHTSQQPTESFMQPHTITLIQNSYYESSVIISQKSTIGISYLGGVALFNPFNELLLPEEKRLVAMTTIGFTDAEIARDSNTNTAEIQARRKHVSEVLLIDLDHDDALDQCLDVDSPLMVLTKAAQLGALTDLTDLEISIMQGVSRGQSVDELVNDMNKPRNTITAVEARIAKKLGYKRRKVIAAAGILAGMSGKTPYMYPTAQATAAHYQQRPSGENSSIVVSPGYVPIDPRF